MKKHKTKIIWIVWLFLVITWNFGVPDAHPLEDVIVAVGLSLVSILIGKIWK